MEIEALEKVILPLLFRRGEKVFQVMPVGTVESITVEPVTIFVDTYKKAVSGGTAADADISENL